jgi:hypothetical protein
MKPDQTEDAGAVVEARARGIAMLGRDMGDIRWDG